MLKNEATLRPTVNEDLEKFWFTFIKGAASLFWLLETFSPSFSSSSFVIRVNLLYPRPSLFIYDLLLSLLCFSIFVKYYFQVSFNLTVILSMLKITQNTETELY